jgi:hypothetical protein
LDIACTTIKREVRKMKAKEMAVMLMKHPGAFVAAFICKICVGEIYERAGSEG